MYHGGSVWPFQNGKIADGLWRRGFASQALDLDARILRTVETLRMRPELVAGSGYRAICPVEHCVEAYVDRLGKVVNISEIPQDEQGWTYTAWWKARRRSGSLGLKHAA
jgi:glycogen debranching enzyme